MTRKTIQTRIATMYETMFKNMLVALQSAKYVCTTADIWSSSKRSFLSITVHWVNPYIHCNCFEISIDKLSEYLFCCFCSLINLKLPRECPALACWRFKGAHTYDKISELINDIHTEFKLDARKVVNTTTDNAANIIKAFSALSVLTNPNDLESLDDDNDDNKESFMVGMNVNFIIWLLDHQRCANHTFNLIATLDIKAVLKELSESYEVSRLHYFAFSKCSAIWNLTSRSPQAAEVYLNITGKASSSSCPTCWNSTYDCLLDLMKVQSSLGNLYDELQLLKLKDTDL